MKKFIAASSLLLHSSAAVEKRSDRTGRVAVPRLRAGAVVEAAKKRRSDEEASAASMTARERISRYTQEKQMFFIIDGEGDPVPYLFEDPTMEAGEPTLVQWLCAPVHAPDTNGDGMYDSLVAHAVTFVPHSTFKAAKDSGAPVAGHFATHGYSANWNEAGGYYDEVIVDYDDSSVEQIRGSAVSIYETSLAGGSRGYSGGFTASGAGEWTSTRPIPSWRRSSQAHSEWEVTSSRRSCAPKLTRRFGRKRTILRPRETRSR